jgi:magnesium transporter
MPETRPQYLLVDDDNRVRVLGILKRLSASRRVQWLKKFILSLHPKTLAGFWEELETSDQELIISLADSEYSAELLTELDEENREEIFKSKDSSWIFDRLDELESDDVVEILRGLSQRDANFILRKFDATYSEKIKDLLNYPEGSAGSLMSSEFLAVNRNATVKSIISQFQKVVDEEGVEDIHYVFVVDRGNRLLGYIPIRKLIIEKPGKKAFEIMRPSPVTITPDQDQEHVANIFRDYNLLSAPVVNEHGILLGRITIDDVMDVLAEEASEDILRLGGVTQDENIHTPTIQSVKMRLPWLFVNLGTQMLAAFIVTFFSDTLSKMILLAPLMTVISGQGGNAAVQSITVVVRSLALGELGTTNAFRTVMRETTVGFLTGIANGILIGVAVYIYDKNIGLAVIIFIAMIANMFIAGLVGTVIPLALRKLKIDPALASGPICTTFTDICGFTVFLTLATVLISLTGG